MSATLDALEQQDSNTLPPMWWLSTAPRLADIDPNAAQEYDEAQREETCNDIDA